MSESLFKTMIAGLGQKIGLEDLKSDEDNYCCLGVDEDKIVHIKFDEDSSKIILFSELVEIPIENQDVFFQKILQLNENNPHFCSFAKIANEPNIALQFKTPLIYKISDKEFEDYTEAFIALFDDYKKQLQSL